MNMELAGEEMERVELISNLAKRQRREGKACLGPAPWLKDKTQLTLPAVAVERERKVVRPDPFAFMKGALGLPRVRSQRAAQQGRIRELQDGQELRRHRRTSDLSHLVLARPSSSRMVAGRT